MSFLGIDLGTSGLRALLVDDDGQPLGSAERSFEVSRPHPGWSEQDPADWIAALEAAVAELRTTSDAFADVKGIAVAGHMHGATLLGADEKVLRPCILWNDTRAHEEARRLDQTDRVRELSGNIVFPGFTAPKLEWVRQHEPDIWTRVEKVLLPAAYLNLYLTGDHVADMSDSAGTSWLDVGRRDWSDTLLDAGSMRRDQMPRLVEGSEVAGRLRRDLARDWGIDPTCVVAGGAGDNAAAACGIGALSEGQGFVSLGTSGVLLIARDGYHPAPETAVHTFCHAVPDRWYQMGVMLSATDSLNWVARITGQTPRSLSEALGPDLQAPGSVRFLPYLSGERTPHNDADIRGAFTGLSGETGVTDLTRAVFEGVAFGLRDSFDALKQTGASMDTVFAIGGGAASDYWLTLIATVLRTPMLQPKGSEFGAALGAARLAMVAAGQGTVEEIMRPPEAGEQIDPHETMADTFAAAHANFRDAYGPLKSMQ